MSQENRHSTYGELIFVGVIALVFVLQLGMAISYPADPRLFPLIIAFFGILLAFATQIGEKLINYIHGKTLANERQTDTHRPSALEIVLQYSSKAEK